MIPYWRCVLNCLDEYVKLVIKPLEDFRKEILVLYFKSFFYKRTYKKMLDEIDNLLISKYEKYYQIIEEEYEFNKNLLEKM